MATVLQVSRAAPAPAAATVSQQGAFRRRLPLLCSHKVAVDYLTVFHSLTQHFSLDTSHQVANLAWHLTVEGVNLTPTKPIRNTDKMPQYKGLVRTDGADNLVQRAATN